MKGVKLLPTDLVVVPVIKDAEQFYVNAVGCIRYSHNKDRESSVIEPYYLRFYPTKTNTKIVGTIAKDGTIDFTLDDYTVMPLKDLLEVNEVKIYDLPEDYKFVVLETTEELDK